MNSEKIKKITNQAIAQLTTALKEGRSETPTHFQPRNAKSHPIAPKVSLLSTFA